MRVSQSALSRGIRGIPLVRAVTRRMKRLPRIAVVAALVTGASAVHAQKDVADPLEHFLGTSAPGRAKRALADGVARLVGDFNNDGLVDVALWQDSDFGPYAGPVFLYLGRKDGRYTASGTIVVSVGSLFKPVPVDTGSARLLVCQRNGPNEAIPAGYSVEGFTVADLPKEELPSACTPANRASEICREACGEDVPPAIERLDVGRYRTSGFQAWIAR